MTTVLLFLSLCFFTTHTKKFINVRHTNKPYQSGLSVPKAYAQYKAFVDERMHSFNATYKNLPLMTDIICNPLSLVTWWRFDLIAKYLYAVAYMKGVEHVWARELYAEHLRVWGNLKEWDGTRTSLEEYLTSFHSTIESISTSGFDPSISRIRIDDRFFPCDGAHRIIASLINNVPIVCYYNPAKNLNKACQATSLFFSVYDRYVPGGLAKKYLDCMALAYTSLKPDSRLLVILSEKHSLSETVLPIIRESANSVYYAPLSLSCTQFQSLLSLLYPSLKNLDNSRCYTGVSNAFGHIFLLAPHISDTLENFANLHANLRQSCSILCSYTTTTHSKTVTLAELFFNNNSLLMLNDGLYALLEKKYKSTIDTFITWCKNNNLDHRDFCVAHESLHAAAHHEGTPPLTMYYHQEKPLPPLTAANIILAYNDSDTTATIIHHPEHHGYCGSIKWEYKSEE